MGTLTVTKGTSTLQKRPAPSFTATVDQARDAASPSTSVGWDAITGKPDFGTASLRNVPASGDATPVQVVLGSDTRLIGGSAILGVNQGGTGSNDTDQALLNLGLNADGRDAVKNATSLGASLVKAASIAAAQILLGGTIVGRNVFGAIDQAAARAAIGAGTSSFDGQYSSLTGKPTLGTASALNVAAAGNAAAGEVVKGSDTRLIGGTTVVAVAQGGTGATTQANARTNLGSTTVGDAVFVAASAAAARTAIGAGTSSLALGTTNVTAKAGDYQPTIPTQAQAEAGTDNTTYMTPLRTAQAINVLATAGSMSYSARASNTVLGLLDKSKLIDFTTGFTQTLTAAATLGNGWTVYLLNSSTSEVVIDPNGAELIDGRATYTMSPGERRLIECDGTTFRTVLASSNSGVVRKPIFTPLAASLNAGTTNDPIFNTTVLAGGASVPRLAANATNFVAATNVATGPLSSPDGRVWTQRTATGFANTSDVASDGVDFALITSGSANNWYSADGITYTAGTALPVTAPTGLASGRRIIARLAGKTLAIGTGYTNLYLSTDNHVTWSAAQANPNTSFFQSVHSLPAVGLFVGLPLQSTVSANYYTSTTGLAGSWTTRNFPTGASCRVVQDTDGSLIATTTTGVLGRVYRSTDGVNWVDLNAVDIGVGAGAVFSVNGVLISFSASVPYTYNNGRWTMRGSTAAMTASNTYWAQKGPITIIGSITPSLNVGIIDATATDASTGLFD